MTSYQKSWKIEVELYTYKKLHSAQNDNIHNYFFFYEFIPSFNNVAVIFPNILFYITLSAFPFPLLKTTTTTDPFQIFRHACVGVTEYTSEVSC